MDLQSLFQHNARLAGQFYSEPNRVVATSSNVKTIVSLRRSGDIINLLPLLYREHQRGAKIRLVVHRDYAPLLEGVSYIEPLIWNGDWEDCLAAAGQFQAVNAQVWGKGVSMDLNRDNFAKGAWEKLGAKWNRYLPLVFDRRDMKREQALAKRVFKTAKPKILVNLKSISSPLPRASDVRTRLTERFDKPAELVWLDDLQADRLYDLLGLMDQAACLVTVDTSTLHLAHASRVPMIAFVNGTGFAASPPRGNLLLRIPYNLVLAKWAEIESTISKTIQRDPVVEGIALVFSDFVAKDIVSKNRNATAWATWPSLEARPVCFHAKRDSLSIGDPRAVPFVRDMIESALNTGPEKIIAITNNDIRFDPKLVTHVRQSCAVYGCYWAYRLDRPGGKTDQGADFFAFTRDWWRLHEHLFPDFLLGYWWWDDILIRIMRWSGCSEQQRLYYHNPHPGVGTRLQEAGNLYNIRLAQEWLVRHDEPHEKPEV